MDGLVTNIALIAGVGGGRVSPHTVILTGFAGLVAGAVSMGLGEYTSVRTQNDQVAHEIAKERAELERNPEIDAQEELGVNPSEQPSPWTAAFSSFLCFSIGALVPLLPYLAGATALWLSLAV